MNLAFGCRAAKRKVSIMKTKRMKFLGILLMAVCLMGCTKPNDDNGGNNNGGGGSNTDYAALIHKGCWSMSSPTYATTSISLCFDYHNQDGTINFFYGGQVLDADALSANGTYTVSGNVITAKYTDVKVIIGTGTSWHYGHTYGFVNGQSKTVTYTIQSCTANKLVLKENALGETLTLTKE